MKLAVPVSRSFAARAASLLLAAALQPLTAAAQAPPAATPSIPADALQQMQQMGGQGGPLADGLARVNRMNNPKLGNRPGDDKLTCEQIKAEFVATDAKYTAQSAREEKARAAVEADATQLAAEAGSSPGAVASGFFGGLAAIGAQVVGAGDAYNEKLKADLMARETKKQERQNQLVKELEASNAIGARGDALIALAKARGCKGANTVP